MICYKDMAFCPFWRDCDKAKDCHRPLTDQVAAEAKSFGLPTAQFVSRPACHSKPYNIPVVLLPQEGTNP